MKKIISIILAIALLAVPFCGITASADDYIGTEIIKDGGFDTDLGTNWQALLGGTIVKAPDAIADGEYGAKAGDNCARAASANYIPWQSVTLQGGYVYELSFLLAPGAHSGSSNEIEIAIGKSGTFAFHEYYTSYEYGYRKLTYTFEVATTAESYWFYIYSKLFEAWVDDISLKAIAPIDTTDYSSYITNELVSNGDFEEGYTSNWSGNGNGLTIQNGAAGYWWGGNGTLSTDVKVEQGRTYKVSYQWKSGGAYDFTTKALQGENVLHSDTWKTQNTNGGLWGRAYNFTAAADGIVTISFSCNPSDSVTALDNISVTPVISAEPTELILNGGFDTLENWINWASHVNPSEDITNDTENMAISISNHNLGVMQRVELTAGTTYKFSMKWAPCWYQKDGGIEESTIKFMVIENSVDWEVESNRMVNEVFKSQDFRFIDYSYTFTATQTSTFRVWIQGPVAVDGVQYIDDVSLVPVNNENAVINGNFEVAPAPAGALDYFKASDSYYGWCLDGSAVTVADADKGSNVLKAAGATDGAYGYARVANSENVLAFNYKGEADSSAKLVVSSDFEGANILTEKPVTGTGAWEQIMVDSDIAAGNVYIHVVSLAGTNYFDDISIMSYDIAAVNGFAPTVDDNYIYGVSGADINAGYSCDNAVVSASAESAVTGVKVKATIGGKFILWEKEIVISGDVTGDGVCNIFDLVAAKKQAAGIDRLSGAYLRAACSDGDVNAIDLNSIRGKVLA